MYLMCFICLGNIDQAQYCDKIKGIVDFLGSKLSLDELSMIWKMQVACRKIINLIFFILLTFN